MASVQTECHTERPAFVEIVAHANCCKRVLREYEHLFFRSGVVSDERTGILAVLRLHLEFVAEGGRVECDTDRPVSALRTEFLRIALRIDVVAGHTLSFRDCLILLGERNSRSRCEEKRREE